MDSRSSNFEITTGRERGKSRCLVLDYSTREESEGDYVRPNDNPSAPYLEKSKQVTWADIVRRND